MTGQIIKLLNAGGFVSGTCMSKELLITRAAVWKRIKTLKAKGFIIETSRGKGYRLIDTPDFSADELKTLIKGQIGKEIIYFKEIASTNDFAMGAGTASSVTLQHGAVVIADTQTKGKGRLGRVWLSPAGMNIYMSIVLKPDIALKDATLLTLLSSVSAATAIRRLTGLPLSIKWPNDLMAGDKKLGGILLEIRSEPDRILFAVAGIGINVNMPIKSLPTELRPVSTSLFEETGRRYKTTLLIAEILNEIDNNLNILQNQGRDEILKKWRELSSTLGKKVMVTIGGGGQTIKGIATDIDDNGRLILKTNDNKKTKISAGDLTILR